MDYRDGADMYRFTADQNEMLTELMQPDYYPLFAELLGDAVGNGGTYGLGLDINPDLQVKTYNMFYLPETADQFDFTRYDYVVDAIDTVTGKIALVLHAQRDNVPVISSMGAGNKLDASQFEVADIYKTSVCPLAKVMRRELKRRGVKHLKVVYSKEVPLTPDYEACGEDARVHGKQGPGSSAFVPSVA